MILFYHPNISSPIHELGPDESRHCMKVLRKKPGDTIYLTDGQGTLFRALITNEDHRKCRVEIVGTEKQEKRRPWWVHLVVAPTKNIARFEWFLEKATEIGVDEITPVFCSNSERKHLNTARLKKVLVAAMKQSLKPFLPRLNEAVPFKNFLQSDHPEPKYIAYCSDTYRNELRDIHRNNGDALILIGPEGDFSAEELEAALKKGFQPVSLGDSRLRTETAAIASCLTIELINRQ